MNRLQTRTCHRAPRHAGSARSGNADGGGGAGNADGGGDAGGAGGRFAPHGSMRHTSAATMRTRMPGLSGREGKEPPSAARFAKASLAAESDCSCQGCFLLLRASNKERHQSLGRCRPLHATHLSIYLGHTAIPRSEGTSCSAAARYVYL